MTLGTRTAINFAGTLAVIGSVVWFFLGGLERYMQMTMSELLRMHDLELVSRLGGLLKKRLGDAITPADLEAMHAEAKKFFSDWEPELKDHQSTIAPDRLVKPSIRDEPAAPKDEQNHDESQSGSMSKKGGNGGGGGGHRHPLIQGLIQTLPEHGTDWGSQDRANWLTLANSIFKMIYTGDDGDIQVVNSAKGGPHSAA